MVSLIDDRAPAAMSDEQTYYECSGGRKTFYALTFILLLPFFISLPIMIGQRIIKGVWIDTWGLSVIAVAFTIVMALLLLELIFSLRAKVDIGSNAVAFTLPRGGGGMTPTVFYQSRTISYSDIATVQSYCDCYGGTIAPVILRGTRLVLKTGERIPLGFVNVVDDDPRFPFAQIANQIADRAGLKVDDLGHIRYALHKRMFGITHGGNGMPPEAVASVNRQHSLFLIGLTVLMVVLLALGVGSDFLQSSAERGEHGVTQPLVPR